MRRDFRYRLKSNKFAAVIILIACFLAGIAVSAAFGVSNLPPKDAVGLLLSPIQSAGAAVGNKISDISDTFFKYDELVSENEALRNELAQLRIENDNLYYLQYENEQLRKLFDFSQTRAEYSYAQAGVVARSSDGWSRRMTLNRGSAAGIAIDDVVVTGEGLVGIVEDVGPNWSTVVCVTDPSVSVGALVSRSGDVGIAESSVEYMQRGQLCLRYLSSSASVNRGDTVVTSGYGGIYPESILIGTVSELISEPDDLSVTAVITPSVDTDEIRTVFVITNFEQKEISDESQD